MSFWNGLCPWSAGVVTAAPWPFDDPMSLYEDSPDREWARLRAVWTGRGKVPGPSSATDA